MAFALVNLQNLSGSGNAPKIWTYSTTDNKAAMEGAGYFNEAAGLLAVNDAIYVACSDANIFKHVSAISAGVVTVADNEAT
jgi:hypothetical protein